jgi:hypothetical protein
MVLCKTSIFSHFSHVFAYFPYVLVGKKITRSSEDFQVYAGAGVVEGSDPSEEFEEISSLVVGLCKIYSTPL